MGEPEIDVIGHTATLSAFLQKMIAHCAAHPGFTELGLLHLIQDFGPLTIRVAAMEAAEGMAAELPRWAAPVEVRVERSWRWRADAGDLAAVGFLFDDGRRPQAFSVLIDHLNGGGISGVVVADGNRAGQPRDEQEAAMTAQIDGHFEDVDAAVALTELHSRCTTRAGRV